LIFSKDENMYVMFLDESGDHNLEKIDNSYPIFCLTGCIVEIGYYTSVFEAKIDELKIKYFNNNNVILRSYDIRKQKGQFSLLVNKKLRDKFYRDLNKLVTGLNFVVIASVINKLKLKERYQNPKDPYDLCFQFIMERYCMFLGEKKDSGIFRMESRESHNDIKLADDFEEFRNKGNNIFSSVEVKQKLVDLSFNQKKQNIASHQIADLTAYPIGSFVFQPKRVNPAFEIIKDKIHCKKGTSYFLNCGLKIFP